MLWFDRAGLAQDSYASLAAGMAVKRPRVLAWAATETGYAVGLPDRLAIQSADAWAFLPWAEMRHVVWEPEGTTLTWRTLDGVHGSVVVPDPQQLPELCRERVNASIVVSEPVTLPGIPDALVTARRDPARPNEPLRWGVVAGDADLSDPSLRAAIERAVAMVRSEYDMG